LIRGLLNESPDQFTFAAYLSQKWSFVMGTPWWGEGRGGKDKVWFNTAPSVQALPPAPFELVSTPF